MENLGLGDRLTMMFLVVESAQANPDVAMSVTVKLPAVLYLCVGLVAVDVMPLPNLQR